MKLKKAMTFKPIKGMWKNVSGNSEVLATTLERLNLIVDKKMPICTIYGLQTQPIYKLSRLQRYENNNYYMEHRVNWKPLIYRYNVLKDGKHVKCNILGWRTALATARKFTTNLFEEVQKVEILNLWTGEIVSLEEAERRSKKFIGA